jgi:hypothetical protein
MKKNLVFVLIATMMAIVLSTTAYAAVTGCWDGVADCTGRVGWMYNDSVNGTNMVDAGRVCWNTTHFNVVPTAAYYCSNNATRNINGTCFAEIYYTGFDGLNSSESVTNPNCTVTGWVNSSIGYTQAEFSVYNSTGNSTGRYNSKVAINDQVYTLAVTTTWGSCVNAYTRNGTYTVPGRSCTGYSYKAVANTYEGARYNTSAVQIGRICAPNNGSSQYANSSDKCGTWYNCTDAATTAAYLYVGYSTAMTNGSCDGTDAQVVGTTYTAPSGRHITNTAEAAACTLAGYGYTYDMNDFSPIVVDALGVGGAGFVSWISIIVLLLVVVLLAGFVVKFKNGL